MSSGVIMEVTAQPALLFARLPDARLTAFHSTPKPFGVILTIKRLDDTHDSF